jgi:DNA polymerase-3 subunit epsilon
MKLNLIRDLLVFDVETTGLSVSKDRIIQLATIKYFADGREPIERVRYINPGMPIPKEVTDLTGINDEMVKDAPTFRQIHKRLLEFIGDADLLTYNGNRFDIPLLLEEFERCGVQLDMTDRKYVDAQRIFHMMEPRTLKAAMKFYCNEELIKAHDALADTKATMSVFEAQVERYEGKETEDKHGNKITPIVNNIDALHDFVNDPNELDFQGKIKLNSEGIAVFTFGKYQLLPVGQSLAGDRKYMHWILNGDFCSDTKRHVQRLVNEYLEQNP